MSKDEKTERCPDDYLRWQQEFMRRIQQGVEAADRDEFADTDEIERVRNKYRPQ